MARYLFDQDENGDFHRYMEGFTKLELIGFMTIELELLKEEVMEQAAGYCDHDPVTGDGEDDPRTYH